jgi:ammonia channel protein AmtB
MGVVTLLWGLVGYSLCFDTSTDTGVIGIVDLAA